MRPCLVTEHAALRARQQFDVPLEDSRRHVADAFERSVAVPWRHSRSLVAVRGMRRKESPTVRVNGTMLLECRGRRVVSVRRLHVDEVATLLIWAAMGAWVAGGV